MRLRHILALPFKLLCGRRLPDLSLSHAAPHIPQKQRAVVDRALEEMYAGRVPTHFRAAADAFAGIARKRGEADGPLKLLDAGCASGYYYEVLGHLAPLEIEYCGVDFSQAMLDLAREKYPSLKVHKMDLRSLDWPDRSFDAVLSGAAIVHIKEWDQAVRELARVAAGWVVLHRTLVCFERPTSIRVERLYGIDMYLIYIREGELLSLMNGLGYRAAARFDCGETASGRDMGSYTYLFEREGP